MQAQNTIKKANELGILLFVENGALKFKTKKGALSDEFKKELANYKQEIIDFLESEPLNLKAPNERPYPVDIADRKSQGLSFSQQRLWFIDKLQGGSLTYNMPAVFEVSGNFDCDRAKRALKALMVRHEILRTVYGESKGEPIQIVLEDMPVPFTRVLNESNDQDSVNTAIANITQYQFNLSKDSPIRVGYIALEASRGILAFNMHHIASDGWSMGILVKEFTGLYQSGTLEDKPQRLQYGDYVHWQRKHFTKKVFGEQLNYWQEQLADVPQVHSLPLANSRAESKGNHAAMVSSKLDARTVAGLESLAQHHGLTMFMLLQGALSLVLSRHSYSQDIVMGTPIVNRQFSELEDVIGCFVNTLVLRTRTDFESLSAFFAHVKDVHLHAQANQDIPFEKLVEVAGVERDAQHNPLIQIMFSLTTEDGIATKGVSLPDIQIKALSEDKIRSKFDLDISVGQQSNQQMWHWIYDTALFTEEQVMRLCEHTSNILEQLALERPDKLSALSMLSAQEVSFQLENLGAGSEISLSESFVHELVSKQAVQHPNKVALVFEQAQMTYGELESASNRLAHYLRAQGVGA
ncbi:condensation domain-containing protein, partial [Pseudoalteromonas rhizosphaerae]|uniref:condensation domain-containing protein n=1 Tax=Pseudoalteromonas rhizosphaerae TaxID=2518973 RepID=UPI00384EBF53